MASPLHDSVAMKLPKVLQMSSEKCRGKHLSYATEKSCRSWALSSIRALVKFPKP